MEENQPNFRGRGKRWHHRGRGSARGNFSQGSDHSNEWDTEDAGTGNRRPYRGRGRYFRPRGRGRQAGGDRAGSANNFNCQTASGIEAEVETGEDYIHIPWDNPGRSAEPGIFSGGLDHSNEWEERDSEDTGTGNRRPNGGRGRNRQRRRKKQAPGEGAGCANNLNCHTASSDIEEETYPKEESVLFDFHLREVEPVNLSQGSDYSNEWEVRDSEDVGTGNRRPYRGRGRNRPRGRGRQAPGDRAGNTNNFNFHMASLSVAEDTYTEEGNMTSSDSSGRRRNSGRGNHANANEDSQNYETKGHFERNSSVDQNAVLHYLVNFHDGSCLVSDLQRNREIFAQETTPYAVVQALKQCRNIKVSTSEGHIENSVVKIILKPLRLCINHKPPKPCSNEKCRYIHLCKDFLLDSCFVKRCCCNHNVESAHNQRITGTCGANIFKSEQKLTLVRCANLQVCREYNSYGGCSRPNSCFKLHICSEYVLNRCLLTDDMCPEGHDLLNERNKKVLVLYEMERWPRETVFKMLLVFRQEACPVKHTSAHCSSLNDFPDEEFNKGFNTCRIETTKTCDTREQEREIAKVQVPNVRRDNLVKFSDFYRSKFKPAFDEAELKNMCEIFEEHKCNLKENCTDRHKCQTPFLWRLKKDGLWINLKSNSDIERAFCDPYNNEFWDLESFPGSALHIDFEEMSSELGQIQRLSTPSYVMCKDKADCTIWQWYWLGGDWNPFASDNQPPYQDILELKYQRDKNLICCFEVGSSYYELDFTEMKQTNLQTGYVREVKRRPVFRDSTGLAARTISGLSFHCDEEKLPAGWMPMDTESKDGTELVPLHSHDATYREIKQKFFSTVAEDRYEIRRIYKLQNLELLNQ